MGTKKKTAICLCLICCLFGYNIVLSIYKITTSGIVFMDFYARWQENAYLYHGINPFLVNSSNYIEKIGMLRSDMVTVPYAWLLGGLFSPGFLPYSIAKFIGFIWFAIGFFGASITVYQYWKLHIANHDQIWALMAALLIGCQIYWWWGIACGNHGLILACIILIVICLYKKYPILCGILMTFAMIKPQLAFPFFVILLLEKEYKVILTSLTCGIISMLSTALIVDSSFTELIIMTFQSGSSLENVYFGLFDFLKFLNISTTNILLCDAIVGILYICILWMFRNREGDQQNIFLKFSGVAIASSFWFYKQPHDNIILAIPCIAFLYLCQSTNTKKKIYLYLFFLVTIIGSFYIQGLCQHILFTAQNLTDAMKISIGRTFQSLYLMICGFCLQNRLSPKQLFVKLSHVSRTGGGTSGGRSVTP